MPYTQIDPVVVPWAETHGLFVATRFKDDEVRSIQIVDDAGDSYGLWISDAAEDGLVSVGIAEHTVGGSRPSSRKVRKQTFSTTVPELGHALESAYALVESWMREKGHTRTAVS